MSNMFYTPHRLLFASEDHTRTWDTHSSILAIFASLTLMLAWTPSHMQVSSANNDQIHNDH